MKTCSICGAQCQDAQVECLSCGKALAVADTPAPANLLDAWRSLKVDRVGTRDPLLLFLWELNRDVPLFKIVETLNRVKAAIYAAKANNGQVMMDNAIVALLCNAMSEEIKALGK